MDSPGNSFMDSAEAKDFFLKKYRDFGISAPKFHFVLGSLFHPVFYELKNSLAFSNWSKTGVIAFSETPFLPSAKAPSHVGNYEYFIHTEKGFSICFQSGRLHGYEGLNPKEAVQTVVGSRQAGTCCFVLTNISGSLKAELPAGSLTAITDHINFTGDSPLRGGLGSSEKKISFLDMVHAYHPQMSSSIREELKKQNQECVSAVYAGVLGPQYETPAEVKMLKACGADIVGMSTVWEVMALRYLQADVCAFSVVSNPASGIGSSVKIQPDLLKPAMENLIKAFLTFAEKQ